MSKPAQAARALEQGGRREASKKAAARLVDVVVRAIGDYIVREGQAKDQKERLTYPGFGTFIRRGRARLKGSQSGLVTFKLGPGLKRLLDDPAFAGPAARPHAALSAGSRTHHSEKRRRKIDPRLAHAQDAIFRLPTLNAGEVSELLGSRSSNARQYAARLRREGALIGLPRGNRYVYPRFQIDARTRLPYPAIKVVGNLLDSAHDPWGVVSWWTSPNSRLPGHQAPTELLGTEGDVDRLTALARSLVADVG